jgi:hypothetical protein
VKSVVERSLAKLNEAKSIKTIVSKIELRSNDEHPEDDDESSPDFPSKPLNGPQARPLRVEELKPFV